MDHKPRHPNHKAATPSIDMDTVASKHPQALEAAAALNLAVSQSSQVNGDRAGILAKAGTLTAHDNFARINHAVEGIQALPAEERKIALKIAMTPGSPFEHDRAEILAKAGTLSANTPGKPLKMKP